MQWGRRTQVQVMTVAGATCGLQLRLFPSAVPRVRPLHGVLRGVFPPGLDCRNVVPAVPFPSQ